MLKLVSDLMPNTAPPIYPPVEMPLQTARNVITRAIYGGGLYSVEVLDAAAALRKSILAADETLLFALGRARRDALEAEQAREPAGIIYGSDRRFTRLKTQKEIDREGQWWLRKSDVDRVIVWTLGLSVGFVAGVLAPLVAR